MQQLLPLGQLKVQILEVCCLGILDRIQVQREVFLAPPTMLICSQVNNKIKPHMFPELKSLLQTQGTLKPQTIGKALDCLRKIDHFRKLENQLGSQYLICLLSSLRPFVLRQGFALLNESDNYVLVEGDLRVQDRRFGGDKPFDAQKMIDLRDHPHLSFVAWNDCSMLRIIKGSGVHSIQQKKLIEVERERTRKYKQYQKILLQPEHQQKMEIIRENSFLSVLAHYDALQLAIASQLRDYSQAAQTHKANSTVQKIGYVFSGKVRLSFDQGNKNRHQNNITWFANEKDWIGLEEALWDQTFQSSGEVCSIGAIILWIPRQIFKCKFNDRTNYEAINRLIGLIKTKRVLFDRSFNSRRKKQEEIEEYHNNNKQISSQLKEKINALQLSQPKKAHFSRTRLQADKKIDLLVPDIMMHKMKNLEQDPILLPRIKEKASLFPEEYATAPVSASYRKELIRLQQAMGKNKQPQSYLTIDHNPETLYRTIYNKISYRFSQRTSRSNIKEHSLEGKTTLHYNKSIYNNFKVGRQKEQNPMKKNKTLNILAHPENC